MAEAVRPPDLVTFIFDTLDFDQDRVHTVESLIRLFRSMGLILNYNDPKAPWKEETVRCVIAGLLDRGDLNMLSYGRLVLPEEKMPEIETEYYQKAWYVIVNGVTSGPFHTEGELQNELSKIRATVRKRVDSEESRTNHSPDGYQEGP